MACSGLVTCAGPLAGRVVGVVRAGPLAEHISEHKVTEHILEQMSDICQNTSGLLTHLLATVTKAWPGLASPCVDYMRPFAFHCQKESIQSIEDKAANKNQSTRKLLVGHKQRQDERIRGGSGLNQVEHHLLPSSGGIGALRFKNRSGCTARARAKQTFPPCMQGRSRTSSVARRCVSDRVGRARSGVVLFATLCRGFRNRPQSTVTVPGRRAMVLAAGEAFGEGF